MQVETLVTARTLEQEAEMLRAHYEKSGVVSINPNDPIVNDSLNRLDAGTLIALVDLIGHRAGSSLNRNLYKRWIEIWTGRSNSEFAIWFNLGVQYGAAKDDANAIVSYKNALILRPDFYQAALNLGTAYEATGQVEAALTVWKKALQPNEARVALLNNCGRALENQKQFKEADQNFVASLLTNPKQPAVLHHWIGLRTRMCEWPVFTSLIPGVTREELLDATRALTLLALVDDVALQDRGNASWIAEKMPPAPHRLSPPQGYRHKKIRLGYMSSDFCMHPMAYLVAELFELHDRERFEIYGYCSTKDDGSDIRKRVVKSFDTYVDIRSLSDEAVARRIRDDEIDILIDLNGLTLGTRLQALRWRPAPVQMTYLGYNGPLPLPELDYIIADEFVIPPASSATHRPPPLYLKDCYQVNDPQQPIAAPPSRQEIGLPDDKFVFCCFSNTYKITEEVFAAWMRILQRTDGTVLWLYADNVYAMDNLKASAERAGVDPNRLIFAKRVEPSQYRGRLALADLFLDTYPYNAGTTASDALRVGLPLITISGQSFIARMAGSLLAFMGLEDCITYSIEHYVDLAVRLASDSQEYRAIRDKITKDLWLKTLGNTPKFCRDFEFALLSVALSAGEVEEPDDPAAVLHLPESVT